MAVLVLNHHILQWANQTILCCAKVASFLVTELPELFNLSKIFDTLLGRRDAPRALLQLFFVTTLRFNFVNIQPSLFALGASLHGTKFISTFLNR